MEQVYLDANKKRETEEKEIYKIENAIENELYKFLVEYENGIIKLQIPNDINLNTNIEIIETLNSRLESVNTMIENEEAFYNDDGLHLTSIAEDFELQNIPIRISTRVKSITTPILKCSWRGCSITYKSWYITYGFNLIANNYVAAIALGTLGILADVAGFILDISIIWKNYDSIFQIIPVSYVRGLHEIVRQLGTLFSGIPSYILTAFELLWNSIVVGSGGGIFKAIITVLKLMLPPIIHGFNIINNAVKNKRGATLSYTAILYSGYKLH